MTGFLERLQEFQQRLLILGRQSPKSMRRLVRFSAVPQNGVTKGHGDTIMHQT